MFFNKSLHKKLDTIIYEQTLVNRRVKLLLEGYIKVMANLDSLKAALEADTSATNSAITLIEELAAQIKAVSADQAAVDALADQFAAQAKALADAVAANTPAAPTA